MDQTLEHQFVEYSVTKLEQLAQRIATCLGMLDEERIWARGNANENAIGNLVLHLCGNVRQWIVAGVGGAADTRQRDAEFAALGGVAPADLAAKLHATVAEAAQVIRALPADRLAERMVVQVYDVSNLEAIYHVVEHFSMHTGQVLFATKMLTGEDLGFYRHLQGGSPPPPQTFPAP
jgi:uncharacterized damage-inducible protein DinB